MPIYSILVAVDFGDACDAAGGLGARAAHGSVDVELWRAAHAVPHRGYLFVPELNEGASL
jgi:hypothetical protein